MISTKSKLNKPKKENFIRIAPGQFFELMRYCRSYADMLIRTPAIHHTVNMIIIFELYYKKLNRTDAWQYYPVNKYRVFRLSYLEYIVLAEELLRHCPNHELNDVLQRLDAMFLNYYDFSLKDKFPIDSKI